MRNKIHNLLHALHEAEKWLEKVKKFVEEMAKDNSGKEGG